MYTEQEIQRQKDRIKKADRGWKRENEEDTLYRMREVNFNELVAIAQVRPPLVISSYDDLQTIQRDLTAPQKVIFERSDGGITDIVLIPGKGKLRACPKKLW